MDKEEGRPRGETGPEGGAPDILVVDDNPANLSLLHDMLESRGFRVRPVPSGALALDAVMSQRPDLILLDINMPKVDGAQFCRFVKRNSMFQAIKVLFCSGEDRSKVERLVAECGADGYILKDEYLGKWIVDNAT